MAQQPVPGRLPDISPSQIAQPMLSADIEEIGPDSRRELLRKFKGVNPAAREYGLNLLMNAYADTVEKPGLRLNRMWVGEGGTLLEIEGLPVHGRRASAVIRQETLEIWHAKGRARLLSYEGATVVKDRRGGGAIVIKPGEILMALFEPVDDYRRPMSVLHTTPEGQRYVYFERIDPRFRERYDDMYRGALAPTATPEQMKDFLVAFAGNDPDGRSREVFLKLINAMRAQNTFEGYYNAYLLIQNPDDARKASMLARSDEHRAKIEHMAVATLADKNRLINFEFSLNPSRANGGEEVNKGLLMPTINFFMGKNAIKVARKPITGVLRASLEKSRPIPLNHGEYAFKFSITAVAPRTGAAEGLVFGGNGDDEMIMRSSATLHLSSNRPSTQMNIDLGEMEIAYLDRGMMGGYTARWLKGDGRVEVRLESVELLK